MSFKYGLQNLTTDILSDIDNSINDILKSVDEVESELADYYDSFDCGERFGDCKTAEVLSSLRKLGVEQISVDGRWTDYMTVIKKFINDLHSELNKSLLDGNVEESTICIARETVMVEQISGNDKIIKSMDTDFKSAFECMVRDVQTYSEKLNKESKGISSYLEQSKVYIADLLNSKIPK